MAMLAATCFGLFVLSGAQNLKLEHDGPSVKKRIVRAQRRFEVTADGANIAQQLGVGVGVGDGEEITAEPTAPRSKVPFTKLLQEVQDEMGWKRMPFPVYGFDQDEEGQPSLIDRDADHEVIISWKRRGDAHHLAAGIKEIMNDGMIGCSVVKGNVKDVIKGVYSREVAFIEKDVRIHTMPDEVLIGKGKNTGNNIVTYDDETRPGKGKNTGSNIDLEQGESRSDPIWSLDRVDARSGEDGSYNPGHDGEGVHVYVVDTGIRTTHEEFEGRAVNIYDTTRDWNPATWPCALTTDWYNNLADCAIDGNGHGTHCAGTVAGKTYGVAKKARVYGLKVMGDDGTGQLSGILGGINHVVEHHVKPAVLSLSLGQPGKIHSYKQAIEYAWDAGITVVVAAGNSNQEACNFSPAYVPKAITVGATASTDERANYMNTRACSPCGDPSWCSNMSECGNMECGQDEFLSCWGSNYGSCIDIWAPGVAILSAGYQGDTDTADMSGSSMACPAVSGAAALLLGQNPQRKPDEVEDLLKSMATRNVLTDLQSSVNSLLYTGEAGQCEDALGAEKCEGYPLICDAKKELGQWMRTQCQRTCGLCPAPAPTAPAPTTPAPT